MAQAQASGSPFGQPPNASVPNSFPRDHIAAGETVIYETRPSLVPFILGGIAYLVFGLLITSAVAAGTRGAFTSGLGVVLFIFVVLPILVIVLGYFRWTRTSYAITDKRALYSSGIFSRNLSDCAHNKVQNVTLHQNVFDRLFGYGHLIFSTAGISSTRRQDVIRGGGVYWEGAKDPVNTRRFVQEVTEYLSRQQKISDFQDMARVLQASGASMTSGVPVTAAAAQPVGRCAKCGAPLTPGSRFCNSCGAPI